ncbi:MAG: tetratricopeptide repeat protein, partial [Xenococcaceae cyanobacterium MO_167.B27]|nr:tetratricopeptide repeat protein [Xenococcaceae cyanobacterium MO_167.B27]
MSTDIEQAKVSENLGQVNKPQQQGNMVSIESYQKALELNPNSVTALSELAQIYREQKQYDGAFTYYLKLVSLRPKKPSFLQSLVRVSTDYAKVLLKKNDLNRAIAAYQEFLNQKLPKDNLDKIDRICKILGDLIVKLSVRQGAFSSPTTFFQEAIEKYPYKVWSYYHLGNILAKQDKLNEAIACYEKAVEIRPKFSLGLLSLGRLLLKKGHRNKAFQCGLKILEYQGRFKNVGLNQNLLKLLSMQSKNKQSPEALQKTIEQIETSSFKPKVKLAVYRNIAKILRNQNKLDEAIEFYQKSLYLSLQKSKPEFVENHWEEGKLQAPDFSVIGFGKCGTSAFYDYLCQHPQVLPAVEKEPMYFYHGLVKSKKDVETKDWSLPSPEKDLYLAHFAPRPEGSHFITGEASTTNVFPGCDTIMSSWFP